MNNKHEAKPSFVESVLVPVGVFEKITEGKHRPSTHGNSNNDDEQLSTFGHLINERIKRKRKPESAKELSTYGHIIGDRVKQKDLLAKKGYVEKLKERLLGNSDTEFSKSDSKFDKAEKAVRFLDEEQMERFLLEAQNNNWFDWNSDFELILDGKVMHKSNILDILNSYLSERKGERGKRYMTSVSDERLMPYGSGLLLQHLRMRGLTKPKLSELFGFDAKQLNKATKQRTKIDREKIRDQQQMANQRRQREKEHKREGEIARREEIEKIEQLKRAKKFMELNADEKLDRRSTMVPVWGRQDEEEEEQGEEEMMRMTTTGQSM